MPVDQINEHDDDDNAPRGDADLAMLFFHRGVGFCLEVLNPIGAVAVSIFPFGAEPTVQFASDKKEKPHEKRDHTHPHSQKPHEPEEIHGTCLKKLRRKIKEPPPPTKSPAKVVAR